MLEIAKSKKIYRELNLGSVEQTGLPESQYDLMSMCLVDEHIADLTTVYREAQRLACPQAKLVVVGMHPFFFMRGMPTHYDDKNGASKAIETHIHLFSHHFNAAQSAQWTLRECYEGVIDDEWIKIKPKWVHSLDCPIHYAYVWEQI